MRIHPLAWTLVILMVTGIRTLAVPPLGDPAFFPIAVWLQDPANAEAYRRAGINTYVALWKGPTETQLAALRAAGMKLICRQDDVGLKHLGDDLILAWMHDDEPDNAQELGDGKGYGPPIPADRIIADYHRMRATDPSRPILLNLGQGVAWDDWIGRGVRRNHPEDYPEYLKGCDIVSFDIYPAVHDAPEVSGNLEFVARGVGRLVQWGGGRKTVWNCLECTRIGNPDRKPTPAEVRAEAWMSIIHGSRGLIYFVHQFKPTFREAALLDDPAMLQAVTALNRQITSLAAVVNSPPITGTWSVQSDPAAVPIATMVRQADGFTYLFAVGMRNSPAMGTFAIPDLEPGATVEVLDENRKLDPTRGGFTDAFGPWGVHLYRYPSRRAGATP